MPYCHRTTLVLFFVIQLLIYKRNFITCMYEYILYNTAGIYTREASS